MKILQLTSSLGGGGAERIAVSLCNRYAVNKDNEIVFVSILDDSVPENVLYLGELSPRVRLINLHCKTGLHIKAIWRLFKIISRERPDIVHSHVHVTSLILPVIILGGIHFFNTIHTLPERHDANAGIIKKILTHYLFKNNKVRPITISETCHKSYCKTYKIQNDICIPNGSEPLRTTEELGLVKKEIDALKKNSDTTVFIHVGRNHPVKNHGRLFNTFLRLEADGFKFILIVLGNDYDSWEAKLKDSKSVFLLGSKKNVGDYMAQAEFFVLSSDFEGLPMTLLEAMSMGVIPISTPAGGVVDVIKDGVTGYLSESFDDDTFYRKVKKAIAEKGHITSVTIKSYYEKHYSMETCAKRYYQTYLDTCNSRSNKKVEL